jgi:hypothetical protein
MYWLIQIIAIFMFEKIQTQTCSDQKINCLITNDLVMLCEILQAGNFHCRKAPQRESEK